MVWLTQCHQLPGLEKMSLLFATVLAAALAPSFDSFLERASGRWHGGSYSWTLTESPNAMPLGVAPGFVTTPSASSTEVTEVMRSCGGAVQGVQESRECQPAPGKVMLNRQVDGTSFFSCGAWGQAPTYLSNAEESDLLASPNCFGLSTCLVCTPCRLHPRPPVFPDSSRPYPFPVS